jgi:glycosyltransferase involved in cell wall biosynthesis
VGDGRPETGLPREVADRSLSIVIPAYNEAAGIARTIELFVQAGRELTQGAEPALDVVEVVVVDDGSSDRTAAIVAAHSQSDHRIRLVQHESNRGLGAAIRTGIAHSRCDLVLYTDADLPVAPEAIAPALQEFRTSNADLLAGRRSRRGGDGLRRRIYTACYDGLVRVVFGLRVDDVNFAFKLFPRSLGGSVGLRSEGSFIDAELVTRVARCGGRIVPFDLEYLPRQTGESSLGSLSVIRGILVEMAQLVRSIRRMSSDPVLDARRRRRARPGDATPLDEIVK